VGAMSDLSSCFRESCESPLFVLVAMSPFFRTVLFSLGTKPVGSPDRYVCADKEKLGFFVFL